MADESPRLPEPKRIWFEPVSAILMALASLSTAWCSYQSSRWNGQSNALSTHADRLERQASEQHLEAKQIETIQTRMWMEAIDAQLDGDEKLANFYVARFADELKPAYEKWVALKPMENPAAPPHPFVRALYTPRFDREIREAHVEAGRAHALATVNAHSGSTYLGNTVLLATVLFFAGTAGKFDQRRVRWASLGFAVVTFLYAAVRMLLLPVT